MSAIMKMVAVSSGFVVLIAGLLFVRPAEATVLIQIDDTMPGLSVSFSAGAASCSLFIGIATFEEVKVDCPFTGVPGAIGISAPSGNWDITLTSTNLDITATLLDSPSIVSDTIDLNFTFNSVTNTTAFDFDFKSCVTAPCGLVALGSGALETAVTYSVIVTGIGPEPIDAEVKFAPDSRTVPEPTTLMLIGLGFAGLTWSRRRKLS